MDMKNYFKDFDGVAARICLFITILSIIYAQKILTGRIAYFSITLLSGVSVTLLAYIFFRNKIIPVIPQVEHIKSDCVNFKVYVILYTLLYTASIYLLFHHAYHRPLIYFFVIAFACILVMVQIQMFSQHKFAQVLILFEILLISLNIRWGILYEFPSIIGTDPAYHLNFAMNIVDFGKIPTGFQYSTHPIMHLLIVTTNLLGNISPKNSFVFSIGFVVATLLPIFIYLVCKKIFPVQISLLAALIVAVSNYLIWYGYMLFATSMGLVYFIIFLYYMLNGRSVSKKTLAILFFIAIILVHPLTNVVTLYSIISLLLLYTYFIMIDVAHIKKNRIINANIVILFFLFTLAYWMYSAPFSDIPFFDFIIRTIFTKLTTAEVAPPTLSTPIVGVGILNEIINMLGAISVLCLAIIGALHTIRIRSDNIKSIYVVLIGFFIFFAAAVSQIIGFENILPQRWFAFAYLLFAIPASVGFQLIYSININKKFTLYVQSITFFAVAVLMMTSSIANMDSPIYSKDISLRIGYFESELAATDFVVIHSNTTITTDMRYTPMLSNMPNRKMLGGNANVSEFSSGDLVAIREYVRNNRIDIPLASPNGAIPDLLNPDFLQSLELKGVNTIYDNKIVSMYAIS